MVANRTLLLASLLCGALAAACSDRSNSKDPADAVFERGTILTLAGDAPAYVEAVAVDNGRIVYAGAADGAKPFIGPQTVRHDLGGRFMLPGFVDAHGHMVMGGLQARSANLLAPPDGTVTDIPGVVAALKQWAAANPDAVKKANVIVGFGYDNAQLKELRHPTKKNWIRCRRTYRSSSSTSRVISPASTRRR